MKECDPNMSNNELCEADKPLPDGNTDYEVDNCVDEFDVYKCVRGKQIFSVFLEKL